MAPNSRPANTCVKRHTPDDVFRTDSIRGQHRCTVSEQGHNKKKGMCSEEIELCGAGEGCWCIETKTRNFLSLCLVVLQYHFVESEGRSWNADMVVWECWANKAVAQAAVHAKFRGTHQELSLQSTPYLEHFPPGGMIDQC